MRVPLANVTTEQLRQADFIAAVDPHRPSYYQQVYGQGVVPPVRPHGTAPHENRALGVEIDSGQWGQLQDLLRRVEVAKGGLHPHVQALKK